MSESEKLETLRLMLDEGCEAEDDRVLLTFLRIAGEKIIAKAYPFKTDVTTVPSRYALLQVEIAQYMMNKRGAEGETYHGENGIFRTFSGSEIPADMLNCVVPLAEVV